MSINIVPDDILYIIMSFIRDNKTSINFISSCKYFKNLFYKYGYIKNLSFSRPNDMFEIAILSSNHSKTLNCISAHNQLNPHNWFGTWPKCVLMNNCTISQKIEPAKLTETEYLYILNSRKYKDIKIDKTKFPRLKQLTITYL